MKKMIFSLFILFISVFALPAPVSAKVMMQEKGNITIPSGETIDDDLFVAAETVEINGTVNGDVYAGAGTVRIGGTIKGALVVGTGDLTLTKATIANSLIVGAGNVTIDDASKIGGSLISGAGDIKNSGVVVRNVMIGAGSIYLNGPIGKEARLGAGTIELGSKFKLNGDLTYALGDESSVLTQNETAAISGETSRFTPPEKSKAEMDKAREDLRAFGKVIGTFWMIFSFVSSLLFGLLLLRFLPKTMDGIANIIGANASKSLGIGLLIVVLAVPTLLVTMLTIIGIPLAGLLLVLLYIDLHLARLVSVYTFGKFLSSIFNWPGISQYLVYVLGLCAFYLIRMIPLIGGLSSGLFTLAGLGAIWMYISAHRKTL
jgi:cytoskeletal protein CcmA (bactofilin family)